MKAPTVKQVYIEIQISVTNIIDLYQTLESDLFDNMLISVKGI